MSPIGSLILGCAGWGGKSIRGTSKSNCILLTARVTVVCSSDSASKAAVCHHRSHAKATAHTEQSAVSTGQPVAFENFVAEPADGSTSLTLLFKSSSSSLKLPVSSNNSEAAIYEDNASSNNKKKCLIVIFFVLCFHSCHVVIGKDIV